MATITVQTMGGQQDVDAVSTLGHFAVHRVLPSGFKDALRLPDRWTVTHVASGYASVPSKSAGGFFATQEAAEKFMAELHESAVRFPVWGRLKDAAGFNKAKKNAKFAVEIARLKVLAIETGAEPL